MEELEGKLEASMHDAAVAMSKACTDAKAAERLTDRVTELKKRLEESQAQHEELENACAQLTERLLEAQQGLEVEEELWQGIVSDPDWLPDQRQGQLQVPRLAHEGLKSLVISSWKGDDGNYKPNNNSRDTTYLNIINIGTKRFSTRGPSM